MIQTLTTGIMSVGIGLYSLQVKKGKKKKKEEIKPQWRGIMPVR